MATRKDWITKKLDNFKSFIREAIPDSPEGAKCLERMELLSKITYSQFVFYVVSELSGHKDNLPKFVDMQMTTCGLPTDAIKAEDKQKICAYLNCFIDFIADEDGA